MKNHHQRLIKELELTKADRGIRLKKTKKLIKKKVYAIDPHVHSKYSTDGVGEILRFSDVAKLAGLDFLFITDHFSRKQKEETDKIDNLSWGQEPGIWPHHIGVLKGSKLLRYKKELIDFDIKADYNTARQISPFVFLPHPTGFYPKAVYNKHQLDSIWELGDDFPMEVINAAGKLSRGWDEFNAKNIIYWDKLLSAKKKIQPLAGSDTHLPEGVGLVFTGVYCSKLNDDCLISAMKAGNCFASETSILNLTCKGKPMGSTIKAKCGTKIDLEITIADSAGLKEARIVTTNGRVVKKINLEGKTFINAKIPLKISSKTLYYRLESVASDDMRGFSSPIYILPQP